MKRFNLVLVNQESGVGHQALRALSRVFKRNFVFEVSSLEEAQGILAKLHIDLLVIDLDNFPTSLTDFGGRYPNLPVMGMAQNPARVESMIDRSLHKVFDKRDFIGGLSAELKTFRKELQHPARNVRPTKQQDPAVPTDFRDFFKLVPSKVRQG